jgi:hypothetical protein
VNDATSVLVSTRVFFSCKHSLPVREGQTSLGGEGCEMRSSREAAQRVEERAQLEPVWCANNGSEKTWGIDGLCAGASLSAAFVCSVAVPISASRLRSCDQGKRAEEGNDDLVNHPLQNTKRRFQSARLRSRCLTAARRVCQPGFVIGPDPGIS